MRALPIIVDLFLLLTIFAVTLFYAAFGISAPNEDSSQLTMIEVSARLQNPAAGGSSDANSVVDIRAELVDEAGQRIIEAPIEVNHPTPGMRRFLVRKAPEGASFQVVITDVDPSAFEGGALSLRLERLYPGHAVENDTQPIGQARLVKVGLR
ncbi:hypothetical protein [Phaeobacter inhibens]|uniref:hypothetical protein n=1 Tax=Phaeobacter inhibens TaxID=221822 RepID=UPI0021A4A74D|nr:hypothetical protein [Phaeobacter inhibens]UWS07078.1 hypothetical protein K4K98_12620 [Phaeobacter inhibens]